MQEQTRAERWLYATLAGDGALTALVASDPVTGGPAIYGAPGPENGAYPRVTWNLQAAGRDTRPVFGVRVLTDLLYQVKAVGKTETYLDLEALADRLDALLDATTGGPTSGGGHVLLSVRDRAVIYPEVTDGVSFRHVGGLYRILVQPA